MKLQNLSCALISLVFTTALADTVERTDRTGTRMLRGRSSDRERQRVLNHDDDHEDKNRELLKKDKGGKFERKLDRDDDGDHDREVNHDDDHEDKNRELFKKDKGDKFGRKLLKDKKGKFDRKLHHDDDDDDDDDDDHDRELNLDDDDEEGTTGIPNESNPDLPIDKFI